MSRKEEHEQGETKRRSGVEKERKVRNKKEKKQNGQDEVRNMRVGRVSLRRTIWSAKNSMGTGRKASLFRKPLPSEGS